MGAQADQLTVLAQQAVATGDREGALQIVEAVLRRDPGNVQARTVQTAIENAPAGNAAAASVASDHGDRPRLERTRGQRPGHRRRHHPQQGGGRRTDSARRTRPAGTPRSRRHVPRRSRARTSRLLANARSRSHQHGDRSSRADGGGTANRHSRIEARPGKRSPRGRTRRRHAGLARRQALDRPPRSDPQGVASRTNSIDCATKSWPPFATRSFSTPS